MFDACTVPLHTFGATYFGLFALSLKSLALQGLDMALLLLWLNVNVRELASLGRSAKSGARG